MIGDLDTSKWQLIDDGDFTFRVPPDFAEVAVQPIDSHVRHFATSDGLRRLGFDYGHFSSPLDEYRALPEFAECRVEFDVA